MRDSRPPRGGARKGDFQGMGVYSSDVSFRSVVAAREITELSRAARIGSNEPTRLSLGMVASLQSPLPFHLVP